MNREMNLVFFQSVRISHYQRAGKLLLFVLITCMAVSAVDKPRNGLRRLIHTDVKDSELPVPKNSMPFNKDTFYYGDKSEVIIPLQNRKKDNEIRYASFGSSVTWGAALDDRENEAYAWRLSKFDKERAKNYGLRATGPNYPASCISTMIGEEVFDVIVLEYFCRGPEGLMTFASRIRERFPNAVIIMIKLWSPFQLRDYSKNINVGDFAFDVGFQNDYIHDPNFREAILAYGADKFKYQYADPEDELTNLFFTVAKKIGAHVVYMPLSDKADGLGGWLELGDKLLANDSFHLSSKGHEDIANQINSIVDRVGTPKDTVLGKFNGIDHCYNWFESGVIGEGLEYSANGIIDKMKNTEKYVLSFYNENVNQEGIVQGSGWIKISNLSESKMDFFLGYMTTGPSPSKYPRVQVVRSSKFGSKYILEPESLGWGDKHVHIARIEYIGELNPGAKDEIITFKPLEETEYPFRLVAVIITPTNGNKGEQFSGIGGGN